MGNHFNKKTLLILTFLIAILGMASYLEGQLAMLVVMFAGCIYTSILWISLNQRPGFWRFCVVFVVLGVTNYLSIYTVYPLEFLPRTIAEQVVYIVPSVIGAVVTIACIIKVWKIDLTKYQVLTIISLIIISSLLFGQIDSYIDNGGFTILFNSIFWWLMFSLGLVLPCKIEMRKISKLKRES